MSTLDGERELALPPQPGLWRRIRHIHPGLVLAVLDIIGLCIAAYLSSVELRGGVPYCGPLHGCETVALSQYSRIGGVPVAVFGVGLSAILFSLAVSWWRKGYRWLLAGHYVLSLVGVIFEGYFTYLELFVIDAICVYCVSYAISLLLRFLVTFVVWVRTPAEPRAA
ncbi:MAG TPA: vitamin K epoxide reductase family protein [Candidatus Limnocylindrales bacterium]